MCTSILQAPFKLSSKVMDNDVMDPASWYLRKQGWAGADFNLSHMASAKLGGVKNKTQRTAETLNNPPKRTTPDSGLSIRG